MENKLHPETVAMLASPQMRLGHYLWHRSRNVWTTLTPTQRASFEQKFGWKPPRPGLGMDGKPIVTHGLGPGLDFLFMHREMIKMVNDIQDKHDWPRVTGWDEPPAVGDAMFPVPTELPDLNGKNDVKWQKGIDDWNARWEGMQFDSLSEMGTFLEYGLHALMHERFATLGPSGMYRMNPPVGGSWPTPDARWDVPEYNTLHDPYAAHVHPTFWSIHCWIDGLIDEWIAKKGPVDWTGAWTGPMDHDSDAGGTDNGHGDHDQGGASPGGSTGGRGGEPEGHDQPPDHAMIAPKVVVKPCCVGNGGSAGAESAGTNGAGAIGA